jgi:glyoxylase-like metal-dependent hydrolase (beta-lactamase superfamily II)
MLQRERVAENVYFFQSEVYAQVTAGAIIGPSWAVVIDTLGTPEETLEIRDFIEQEINVPVRYVFNTHYHAIIAGEINFFPEPLLSVIAYVGNGWNSDEHPHSDEVRKQNPALRNVKNRFYLKYLLTRMYQSKGCKKES